MALWIPSACIKLKNGSDGPLHRLTLEVPVAITKKEGWLLYESEGSVFFIINNMTCQALLANFQEEVMLDACKNFVTQACVFANSLCHPEEYSVESQNLYIH